MHKKILAISLFPVYIRLIILAVLIIAGGGGGGRPNMEFIAAVLFLTIIAILLSIKENLLLNGIGAVGFVLWGGYETIIQLSGARIHFWKQSLILGIIMMLWGVGCFIYQLRWNKQIRK